MTITLELSTEQERRLREGAARRDEQAIRQVLLQAVSPAVEELLTRFSGASTRDFETLAEALAERFAATVSAEHRPLPDRAMTRDGIYGDHP